MVPASPGVCHGRGVVPLLEGHLTGILRGLDHLIAQRVGGDRRLQNRVLDYPRPVLHRGFLGRWDDEPGVACLAVCNVAAGSGEHGGEQVSAHFVMPPRGLPNCRAMTASRVVFHARPSAASLRKSAGSTGAMKGQGLEDRPDHPQLHACYWRRGRLGSDAARNLRRDGA